MTLRGWAVVVRGDFFRAVHYIGPLGDPFEPQVVLVFRFCLGMTLTVIFVFRGFAAAVWAHAGSSTTFGFWFFDAYA